MKILRIISILLGLAFSVTASAETKTSPLAEQMISTARDHFAIQIGIAANSQSESQVRQGVTQVEINFLSGERFATYMVRGNGALYEIFLNTPTSKTYKKSHNRRALIEKFIRLAAPSATDEERDWAADQLDLNWSQRVRPLPVQVGSFVFSGITLHSANGAHDHFRITALDAGNTGLKCCKRLFPGGMRPPR